MNNQKKYARRALSTIVTGAVLLLAANAATAAVTQVRCITWQGNPLNYHTAISGQAVQLKAVISTDTTSTIYYKWVYGDGTESTVSSSSGGTRYNVAMNHTYSGGLGAPFTAKLVVANNSTMDSGVIEDPYLIKLEADNLDTRVNIAIDRGLWYLYTHQRSIVSANSRPMTSWASYSSYYPSATGTAIQAFEINSHREINHDVAGQYPEDPYAEAVAAGLNYLINGKEGATFVLASINIGAQTLGNPDSNGNGKGIQVNYPGDPPYQGGMVMDAIISSGTPDADSGRDFDGDGVTDTYKKIVQEMVDAYAWGQADYQSNYSGYTGWAYNWNEWTTDNSANQWAAIGLIPAEQNFGCTIPAFVKENMQRSLTFCYNAGQRYYGYRDSSGLVYGTPGVTRPSGMVQSVLAVPNYKTDIRFTGPLSWYRDNFSAAFSAGQRTYYGWLSFVKAMRLSNIESFDSGLDWYRGDATHTGLAQLLVNEQEADNSWPQGSQITYPGSYGDNFVTSWAIQMLKPALFAAAPIACFDYNPKSTYSGATVTFSPTCSGHSEAGKTIANLTKFEWDWDNDGVYDTETAAPTVQTNSFTCGTPPCTFPVTLRVTDDANPALTATAQQNVTITNPPHPPVADAGGPYIASLCLGDKLELDGSASFDPNDVNHSTLNHQSDCDSCPDDAVTAWDWDLAAPFSPYVDASGAKVTLDSPYVGDLTSAGVRNIGLQVADNTALSFPGSGEPNLTNEDFATVTIYSAAACNLTARGKALSPTNAKIQLVWTKVPGAATYDIYRSSVGPNTGFGKIKSGLVSTYSTYLDTAVSPNVQYWYRVMPNNGGSSKAVVGKAVTR